MFDVSGNLKRQCHVRPELYGSWVLISQRYSGFYYCAVLLLCGFCCCDVWFFLKKIPKIDGFGDFLVCAYLFLFIIFIVYIYHLSG